MTRKLTLFLAASAISFLPSLAFALDDNTDIWLWLKNSEFTCERGSSKFSNWYDSVGRNESEKSRLRNQGYFYILNNSQTKVGGVMATSYEACKRYSSNAEVRRHNARLSGSGGSSKHRYSCSVTCSNLNNSFGNQDTRVQIGITAPSLNSAYNYVNHNYNGICQKRGFRPKFSGNTSCN